MGLRLIELCIGKYSEVTRLFPDYDGTEYYPIPGHRVVSAHRAVPARAGPFPPPDSDINIVQLFAALRLQINNQINDCNVVFQYYIPVNIFMTSD